MMTDDIDHFNDARNFAQEYLANEGLPEEFFYAARIVCSDCITEICNIHLEAIACQMQAARGVLDNDSDAADIDAEYFAFVAAIHVHMRRQGYFQVQGEYVSVEPRAGGEKIPTRRASGMH